MIQYLAKAMMAIVVIAIVSFCGMMNPDFIQFWVLLVKHIIS